MATFAGSPQIAVRARGSNKCLKHIGKELAFYCKNCNNLVCADCVIQGCQEHVFEGISDVVPAYKRKLQDFIFKTELIEIPSIKCKLQAAHSDLTKNQNHFKNEIGKIRKQNEALKEELDKITETCMKIYQGLEKQNTDELLKYKRHLQNRVDKLTSQIKDIKGVLKSGNDILVYDSLHVTQSQFNDIPKTVCSTSTPEFTPGTFSVQVLEQLLGKINTTRHPQSLNMRENWNVTSEFTPYTGYRVKSIHTAGTGDEVWLSFYNAKTKTAVQKMLLTDQSGKVKQTFNMDVNVEDFCCSPLTGKIFYCSRQDSSVREMRGDKSIVRFTTDTPPSCICIDKEGHVVLGFHGQVVKYTQGGEVIYKTSRGNNQAVRTPLHISDCPLTLHVAVVDDDKKEDGGINKPSVSIFNDQLQLLFIYTGELQGQQFLAKTFDPADVFFTGLGELVITDWNNEIVLLVTGTGIYLSSLCTHVKSSPYAVCVHNNAIWISVGDNSVKVFKENTRGIASIFSAYFGIRAANS